MDIFNQLIGNEEIKSSLGSAIVESRFSHAYIIEGAEGTGKKLIARLASAAILCESQLSRPCGKCLACRKVFAETHTDVHFYEATKIDQIREIKQGLYDYPNESDYKIYIFDHAEKMNIKAQNALLISLEEPPKNVVFLLLATDAGALLETIRSRAQTLRTERLDRDTVFAHLKGLGTGLSDEMLEQIVIASGGSLGYAIGLTDEKKSDELFEQRQRALDFACAVIKNDEDSVVHLMSYSSMSRDDLKELISLSLSVIGDLMLLKKDRGVTLNFFTSREDALIIAQRSNLPRLVGCYEALLTAISDLNMNSNTALSLMSILINSKKKGN